MELERVKRTLNQTECKKELLEKELAEASSVKDEASKLKSSLLENFAELMETELQCSICSELFVVVSNVIIYKCDICCKSIAIEVITRKIEVE